MPYGINLKRLEHGLISGGEASFMALTNRRMFRFRAYTDVIHDFGSDATRFTFGPELGLGPLGIDGGAVLSTLDGTHGGLTGRVLFTFGFIAAYARVGGIFDAPRESTYGELGMLLKLPIPVTGAGFDPPRPPPEPAPLQPDPPKEEEKPSRPVAT